MRLIGACALSAGLVATTLLPAGAAQARSKGPDHSAPTVRMGTSKQAGFIPRYINELQDNAYQGTRTQSYGHPAYPGAAFLAARNGIIAASSATGFGVRYADPSNELPRQQWVTARKSTIYDLASLTKTFTAVLAVQQLAKGTIDLDDPVADYIPEFAQAGKGGITIQMLLTHTSGLPPDPTPALWDPIYTTNAQRWAALYATVPVAPPDTEYIYSDINYLMMGKVLEQVTGKSLDVAVRKWITEPLGMNDTMFNPPARLLDRIAATDYEELPVWPARGMVRGQVDDPNAWALGGVAGHAGLFSTTHDLAIYAQMILNRGAYGKVRIVPKSWGPTFYRNYNTAFPGNGHSLIMQVNQYPDYFGAMDTPRTIGHTGFTGTSLVIDPTTESFVILLSNRVHPTFAWNPRPTPNPQRRAVADSVARAVAVPPLEGAYSWFSGMANNAALDTPPAQPSTLTVPVTATGGTTRVTFNLWYQLIPPQAGPPAEQGALLWSADNGTTWNPLPFKVRRQGGTDVYPEGTFTGLGNPGWGTASAVVPLPQTEQSARILLRWQYTDAATWQGRGMYVNSVVVTSGGGTVFDDSSPRAAARVITAGGFRRSVN